MAHNLRVEESSPASASGVGSLSAESFAAAAASPGGPVASESPSAPQKEKPRTTRASTPGVGTTSGSAPVDPEVDGAEGAGDDKHVGPSVGHVRSSPGPAAFGTPPAPQHPSTASSFFPEPADTKALSDADPTSPEPADPTSSDPHPIDMDTLLQILDLDEEGNHDFSRGMAWAYFEQAASTFEDMDNAFAQSSLLTLSSLGHFLKGSSAALGVHKVQKSCEQIQHYGELRDEDNGVDLAEGEALGRIGEVLIRVKREYAEAEKWLKDYYAELDGA